MKKLMKSLMLFAVAAMAFNSCENENVNDSISKGGIQTMTFVAGAPESRTSVSIDGNAANYSWSAGDKVGFYYAATDANYKKKTNSKDATIAGDGTATFTVEFVADANATSYNVGAFYPGNSWGGSHADANYFNNVNVKISNAQALVEGSFDPAADLMMSKPFLGITLDSETTKTLEFTRIAAIGKMNLKLTGMVAGEIIKSVKFTLAEGTHFNGPVVLDLENSTYELGTTNTSNAVALTGSIEAVAEGTPIFFTCFPGEYSGEYTIEVQTDKAYYSKTGTLSKALSFTAGDVLGFNATVSNREAVDEDLYNYEGDYVIVAKRSSGNFFYMTPDVGTASTKRFQAVDTGSTTVDGVTINETYVWTIAKSDAAYTMQAPDGKFVTWSSGNSANLATTGKTLNIEKVEGKEYFKISLVDDSGRILSLNNTSGNNYFAFYAGTQVNDLYLIPVTPADPNAPSLSVAQTEVQLESTECEGTIEIEVKNIEGTPSAESNADWLLVDIDEDGNLYYVAGANDGEARTATVTISANGVEDVVVTFTQAADASALPGTGAGTKASPYDVTRAYAVIDAADGSTVSGVYVKGIVTDVVSFNSSYNSLTYHISVDGTATNKLQAYSGKNLDNTNFTSTGDLHVGDEVVIYGNIKKYGSTYEFDYNNYIVSLNCPHAEGSLDQTIVFDVKPASVTVGKTVTVKASAFTAITYSSSNATIASVDAETGVVTGVKEGTATITATAAAKGVYKSATVSYEITVNAAQSGVVGGGRDDFNTVATNSSYSSRTTTAGWKGTNCAVISGGSSDSNPVFKSLLGTDASVKAFVINGKTSAKGVITSPTLTNGCGTLELKYGYVFSESKAPKFKVEIKQNNVVVKTYNVAGTSYSQKTVWSWSAADVNVAGDFQIVITNLSPSNSTSNKDRTAIWDVIWTGYAE